MDTLTRMRAFKSVVEASGYSAAARKIGRSKALLSKYVRELEDELGARLINRTTRQFSLTPSGQEYYVRAAAVIQDFDDLHESVRSDTGRITGRVSLSTGRTFADSLYGQCLIDFTNAYPEVVLDVSLDDRLIDLVAEGYDVAIRTAELPDSGMIARRLAGFDLLLCASPATLAREGLPQAPADLAGLPCIVDTNSNTRNTWSFESPATGRQAVTVKPVLEVNSPIVVRRALLADLGFAVIPRISVHEELDRGTLVEVLPGQIRSNRAIYAVYPHRQYLPQRVRVFIDFLAEWMKDHAITP